MSKNEQLGMNHSTASNRLVKDLLFDLVVKMGHRCYRCGAELERENFSIDHKVDWLHSDDPIGLFFDLENIAYSHRDCNTASVRRSTPKHGTQMMYQKRKCRCDLCVTAMRQAWNRVPYNPEKRRQQYLRTGT